MKTKKQKKGYPEFLMPSQPWLPEGAVVDKRHKNASKAEMLTEFSEENEK